MVEGTISFTPEAYAEKIKDARADGAFHVKLGLLEYLCKEIVASGNNDPTLIELKDKVVEITDSYVKSLDHK